MRNEAMPAEARGGILPRTGATAPQYDVVIVADYGHGLMTDRAVQLVCEKARFLAVNTQVNAGNKGFNTISKYPRADYVSIGEPEARLDARKASGDLQGFAARSRARIRRRTFWSRAAAPAA